MPRILGELKDACTEQLSADPGGTVQGRIWTNTTENRIKTDDGTNKRALLRNDQNAVIGNSGTANNNVRLHRGDAELLQFVKGGDSTTEASMSTDLAKISAKLESYTDAGKPAFGNAGRSIYLTDTNTLSVDTGSAWNNLLAQSLATTKGDILARSASALTRLGVGSDGQVLTADSAETTGLRWASPGANIVTSIVFADSPYTALVPTDLLLCNATGGAITVNLYTAVGNEGKVLRIKKTDTSSNAVTIDASGAETIDGEATFLLSYKYQVLTLVSDGANWQIVAFDPSAELITTTFTPFSVTTAALVWHAISGNSITLTQGTWDIVGDVRWNSTGNIFSTITVGWFSGNGANNGTTPTAFTGGTVLAGTVGELRVRDINANSFVHSREPGESLIVSVASGGSATLFLDAKSGATGTSYTLNGHIIAKRLR